ncbi:hypothetical protein HYH03_006131 [Edaphochlamys debaryana]|uniref:LTV1 n=1 Tax=Edaphochlamys debaryana TaxID=47281 RepID=A0A835Y6Z4_9CHLO|nr:hypothetical protein HYH03_006131 [Edaphochlamys debaryana]|eukprot:KAG2495893.1 hypothetical protein HYH03_006131 [Edaphochlamys debaryana]
MGKKKFIDKKKATTFSLVYRDVEEEEEGVDDGGQRAWAQTAGPRGPAQQEFDDYYHEDVDSLGDESEFSLARSAAAHAHADDGYSMTEERRRELLALGFPDDGYDYLKHLRDLGRGKPAPGRGVDTIPEEQELEGFEEEVLEGEAEDSEEDFTIYDPPLDAAGPSTSAAGAGPSTSTGAGAGAAAAAEAGPSRLDAQALAQAQAVAAASAAGPGPGSTAARTAAAGRSVAGTARTARSVATTRRTHGSGVGPAVYVPAARLIAPSADVKVVDARSLTVKPKGHDEAAAAAALAEVSALARPKELRGRRGRLVKDLEEVEACMAEVENGNDGALGEVVEGDEWADWLDAFVAGEEEELEGGAAGGAAAGAAGGRRAAAAEAEEEDEEEEDDDEEEEDDEEEAGGESEDPEEQEEGACEWVNRHRRPQASQQQGAAAGSSDAAGSAGAPGPGSARPGPGTARGGVAGGSVVSSFWRPERRDRKQGFEALDAQFERLAVEYDDDEIGVLEDGRYDDADADLDDLDEHDGPGTRRLAGGAKGGAGARQAAAGGCDLADYADVLDEFLEEQKKTEMLEAEGLKPLEATDDVALQAARPDPEALAATRARLRRQEEAAAAAAAAAAARGDAGAAEAAEAGEHMEPRSTLVMREAERWDCESVLSLTSNLENHPAKIVEPQRRTGARGGPAIRLSAKTGMPLLGGTGAGGVDAAIPEGSEEAAEEGSGSGSEDGGEPAGSVLDPALLVRRKGETAEERKERKAAVKEARRAHRTAKKEMKAMFKQQAARAQKQSAGRSQAAGSTYVIP